MLKNALLAAVAAVALACGSSSSTTTPSTQTATPTFSPAAGTYTTAQSVTIACATAGAVIYYTTDGSTPTLASPVYSAPISVASTETLKAYATSNLTPSAVASAAYTITPSTQTATPTFSPAAGTYTTAQSVTIACATAGAVIYYTTDGSTPTLASPVYSAPIAVASTETLKAYATSSLTPSAVASATYTIGSSSGTTDLTALCQGSLDAFKRIETTCFKANPDYVNSFFTNGILNCSATSKEITSGRVSYDSTKGTACASAFSSLTCSQLASGLIPSACTTVLTGKVATGGVCYDDLDCAAGTCTATASACPGTCQAYAQLNQSCASATCAPGLECSTSTQLCATPSAVGGACPCQGGLWCDTSGGAAGTCKASLAVGAACTPSDSSCAIGSVCVGTPSTTCQALVGLGGDCSAGTELCGLGYACDPATTKCASYPKLGETCSASLPVCIGSYCDIAGTLKCVAYKAVGAACNYLVDFLACAPGSSCDQSSATCKANAATTCQAP